MATQDILKEYYAQLVRDEKELLDVDLLLKTARDAGEPLADLEQTQRAIKVRMDKWKTALKNNMK